MPGLPLTLALLGCPVKQVPHGDTGLFPLYHSHLLPCVECHGSHVTKLDPTCKACHLGDFPLGDPDHPSSEDCVGCHSDVSWIDGIDGTTSTPTAPTTPEPTIPTTAPFVHQTVDPNEVCWDCHEGDRPVDHHVDPVDWDCGPCHQQTDWTDGPLEHPVRTPHGETSNGSEQPASAWVVACTGCHPTAPPAFVCSDCHAAIFPHTAFGGPSTPGAAADQTCLGCHEYGLR